MGLGFFLVGIQLTCKIILLLGSQMSDLGLICRNEQYSTDFGAFYLNEKFGECSSKSSQEYSACDGSQIYSGCVVPTLTVKTGRNIT